MLAPPDSRLWEPRFGARERIRERKDQEDSLNIFEAITACDSDALLEYGERNLTAKHAGAHEP